MVSGAARLLRAATKTSLSPKAPLKRGDQLGHFMFPSSKLHLVQLMLWLSGMGKRLRLALLLGLTQLPAWAHQWPRDCKAALQEGEMLKQREGA